MKLKSFSSTTSIYTPHNTPFLTIEVRIRGRVHGLKQQMCQSIHLLLLARPLWLALGRGLPALARNVGGVQRVVGVRRHLAGRARVDWLVDALVRRGSLQDNRNVTIKY